jgi:RecB family exonuclease
MAISKVFLDWKAPVLPATAAYLSERYAATGVLDLQQILVVTPGGRAGRRLLELLVEYAEAHHLALVPPQIVTMGQLPELLYETPRPFAPALTQQLAWVTALRQTERPIVASLTSAPPADHDLFAWLAFGELLATLHYELAGEGLSFATVARRGQSLAAFRERERWQALAALQSRYLEVLDAQGVWDHPTARLWAMDLGGYRTMRDLILVGTVDLTAAQRAMLDQVADRVTALIFAPPALADRFDAHGCLITPAWQEAQIDLDAAEIAIVDNPSDQADAVVRTIARFQGAFAADDITIGVPDPRVLPSLQQRLAEYDLPFRYGVGMPVSSTSPYRLLRAIAAYLDHNSFAAFANLVRHPAVDPWLRTQGISSDWCLELDEYFTTHLPARMNGQWLTAPRARRQLPQAFAVLARLVAPLQRQVRSPHQWTEPILELLRQVYGQSALTSNDEAHRTLLLACEHIQQVAHEHLQVHESLAPPLTGVAALRLILRALDGVTIPPRFAQSAIELLGWLELPLDDAPALLVTGLNEGCVPVSQQGTLFLPEALRRHLGLPDQAQRYARDAYNLAMLAASRTHLTLIAGRRTSEHDVLLPSRLLFTCDETRLLSRTLATFAPQRSSPRPPALPRTLKPGQLHASFAMPRPVSLAEPVTSMPVTAFRDYLACPYRYYLRHHLKLHTVDTTAEELPPGAFGELLHGVLRAFAHSSAAGSSRVAEIREALHATLQTLAQQSFGEEPLPAVHVQVEQARRRLDRFAQWQAERVHQGWRIEYAEALVDGTQAWLTVDGEPMYLRGRIDRIDVHDTTQERIIFDYKAGDTAQKPEAVHRTRQGQWVDLQLPLYRHLVRGCGITTDVQLGYILLPKDLQQIGASVTAWTQADLAQADDVAADVVRHVRAETFWPPSAEPPPFDTFAVLCQGAQNGVLPLQTLMQKD